MRHQVLFIKFILRWVGLGCCINSVVNSNIFSTIKIFLNSIPLTFLFSHSSNTNNFSSLVVVNIFFKYLLRTYLFCLAYITLGTYPWSWAWLILGNPVFSIVSGTYFFLSNLGIFYLGFFLFSLRKTSRIMLNRSDKVGFSCLILDLKRKYSFFRHYYDVIFRFYYRCPLSDWGRSLSFQVYWEILLWMGVEFCQILFLEVIIQLFLYDCQYSKSYWFWKVNPTLHSWNVLRFVMMHILLDLIC